MYPTIGRYDTIFFVWALAAFLGMAIALVLATRDGHPPERSYLALLVLAVIFVLGTKIHFWLANPDLVRTLGIGNLVWYGFHFPGGVLLSAVAGPLMLRSVGLRPLAFLDSIVPATGFAVAVARMGCFANGCCFGYVSGSPWAITFPPGSRAYAHHLEAGLISSGAVSSRPVLPLMLFFAAAGLAIGLTLWLWRRRQKFVGQLTLAFVAMWSVANVIIEFWRDPVMVPGTPHLWGVSVAIAAVSVPMLLVLPSVSRSAFRSRISGLRI